MLRSRGRELVAIGLLFGAVAAVASAARLLFEAPEPPRWSDLPWGLIPDSVVVLLHRVAPSMAWLALGAVWGAAAALGWRLRNVHGEGDPLAFDAVMLVIAATAVAFERDFMAGAPSALRYRSGTPGEWIPTVLDAGVILASVLIASAAWRLLGRLTSGAGSLLASLAVSAYLPWTLLRQAGGGVAEKAVSVFPSASALSLGLASAACCALLFSVFRLVAAAAPSIAPRYQRIHAGVAASRGWLLGATSCLVLAAGFAAGPTGPTGDLPLSSAPNVVLVMVDTLRADHLGAYGYPRPTSPGFDAWARRGVAFRDAYSVSSFTSAGTAGILTSRYPSELGIESNNSYLRPGPATLGEILSARGYRTGAFVSNFILRRPLGYHRGFHVYDDWFPSEEAARDVVERGARQVTDAAIGWLDHRDRARPYFLWVHYQDPHGPYLPPEDATRPFRAADYERVRFVPASRIPSYQIVGERTDARELVAAYDNEIAYWDAHFARLVDRIERDESLRGTFVVFTADHGETLDEPRETPFAHGTGLTEEQVRVPLVFSGPGIAGGRVVEGPVSSLDVLPTLIGLIGGNGRPELRFRGVDLTPILTGDGSTNGSRIVISELPSPSGAFRIAARSSNGFAEVQLAAGEDPGEPPPSTPDPLRRALLDHLSFVLRERTDSLDVELLPSDVEQLRALGYVE